MPSPSSFHTIENREIPNTDGSTESIPNIPNIIPFVAVTSLEEKYNKHYHRWQLPLEHAFACTTHKMQGVTASNGAVVQPSTNKPFARGLDYVATSRPTELSKLFLLGPLTEVHFHAFPKERHAITEEYNRLKNTLSTNQQDVLSGQTIITLALPRDNLDENQLCIICNLDMLDDRGYCENCSENIHCTITKCYMNGNGPLANYVNEKWCSSCYHSIPE